MYNNNNFFMNSLIFSLVLKILSITIPLLLGVAFLTLAERKVMASMQRRKGPNVVGIFGLFQPIADGLKLLITVLLCVGSLNLTEIVLAQQKVWFCIPLFPLLIMFFISCLAETNRAPFDLPEAEAELVAGYNVEYSSMGFALFFLGEYANMIVMSSLCALFFLGGWLPPLNLAIFYWVPGVFWFGLKIVFFLFVFIWVRAAFPRYRYDQLMRLGWKVLLPLSLAWVILVSGVLISFDWLP